jgi:hypothetical protein
LSFKIKFDGLASKPRFSLVWPQNQWRWLFSSLGSKLMATVSPNLASKPAVSFLVEPQNQITVTVLGLGFKTKQASIYRLRHKTNGGSSPWDTRRDLAACLAWKQV